MRIEVGQPMETLREAGLHDRSSTPRHSPNATPAWVIERIETWRRDHKWSAQRITDELADLGFTTMSTRGGFQSTSQRWLVRRG